MFTFIFSPLLLQWRKHISTLCMKWDPIFSTFSVPCQLASPVTPTSLSLSLVFVWGALWSSGANLQDLSSSTRDTTCAPCSGSKVTSSLDHQGSPQHYFHLNLLGALRGCRMLTLYIFCHCYCCYFKTLHGNLK